MLREGIVAWCIIGSACRVQAFPVPEGDDSVREYHCVFVDQGPLVDGRLDDPAWQAAEWSDHFVDIRGSSHPMPRQDTRMKMLWDEECLYIGAWMDEPHLWATYDEHDMVIYHENDFEFFIDPDGDTHNYYELEINALGTIWDLLLTKPYRDGGQAIDSWGIPGLQSAVYLDGTLNDPSDVDKGWSVELAVPWSVLEECAAHPGPPEVHEFWRMNFSRVQYHLDEIDGEYHKRRDAQSGEELPEDNWVWTPQGLVAMHYPERWGYVYFILDPEQLPRSQYGSAHPGERQRLWYFYYLQKKAHEKGDWIRDPADFLPEQTGFIAEPVFRIDPAGWRLTLDYGHGLVSSIDHEGRFLYRVQR